MRADTQLSRGFLHRLTSPIKVALASSLAGRSCGWMNRLHCGLRSKFFVCTASARRRSRGSP